VAARKEEAYQNRVSSTYCEAVTPLVVCSFCKHLAELYWGERMRVMLMDIGQGAP